MYACEWCGRIKKANERWWLALAAEKNGCSGRRCEVERVPVWSAKAAKHPLAVHFCSQEHLDCYTAAVFAIGRTAISALQKASAGGRGGAGRMAEAVIDLPGAKTSSTRRKQKPRKRKAKGWTKEDAMRAHSLGIRLE